MRNLVHLEKFHSFTNMMNISVSQQEKSGKRNPGQILQKQFSEKDKLQEENFRSKLFYRNKNYFLRIDFASKNSMDFSFLCNL